MMQPSNFTGPPSLAPHPAPTPAAPWLPERPALPRTVPTLTVYADGHLNLNGEASALLSALADGICLHPPRKVRAGRLPPPWEVSAGTCATLHPRTDKPGILRCQPAPADCPPPGRYLLTPLAGHPARFSLVPL